MLDYFLFPIIAVLYWKSGERRQRILSYLFSEERLFMHQKVKYEIKNLSYSDKRTIALSITSSVIGGLVLFVLTSVVKLLFSLF